MHSVDPRQDPDDGRDGRANGELVPAPLSLPPALQPVVAGAATRLRLGLRTAFDTSGLTQAEVLTVERAVLHLMRSGMTPSLDRFWRTTALPRAERLGAEARAVIDEVLEQLLVRAGPLGLTVATVDTTVPGVPVVVSPGPEASLIRAQLEAGLPSGEELQVLGRWWLRRLRRSAHLQALTRLGHDHPATLGREAVAGELRLLDRPPWAHGDRLLAAFELVQADIRRYGRRRIADTTDQLVDPDRSWLDALPS